MTRQQEIRTLLAALEWTEYQDNKEPAWALCEHCHGTRPVHKRSCKMKRLITLLTPKTRTRKP